MVMSGCGATFRDQLAFHEVGVSAATGHPDLKDLENDQAWARTGDLPARPATCRRDRRRAAAT
ncbi:hypothetical protein ACFQZ8_32930, partial [Micromonospora azadirachtae]